MLIENDTIYNALVCIVAGTVGRLSAQVTIKMSVSRRRTVKILTAFIMVYRLAIIVSGNPRHLHTSRAAVIITFRGNLYNSVIRDSARRHQVTNYIAYAASSSVTKHIKHCARNT